MGYGHSKLVDLHNKSRIKPSNVVLFGTRDVEEGEGELIRKAGVREFSYDEILEEGFDSSVDEAIEYLKGKSKYLHLSIDLDSLDPEDIMGVSTPVAGGFKVGQLMSLIRKATSSFEITSIDIVEYNPLHDRGEITLDTMIMLVSTLEKLLAERYSG